MYLLPRPATHEVGLGFKKKKRLLTSHLGCTTNCVSQVTGEIADVATATYASFLFFMGHNVADAHVSTAVRFSSVVCRADFAKPTLN